MVDLFNKHPINRPAGITSEYTTNGNIDWIIARLKCLCAISTILSAVSSGESWNKLFFPHKITFLRLNMTGRFWARYKTFWTLSPPIPQSKVFRGSRYFIQTLQYLFSPAAIESLIIIVLKQSDIKLEQWWRWKFNQFIFENLIQGIVVLMVYRLLFKSI